MSSENPTIEIKDIEPLTGNKVEVKEWIIDDTHGNFWLTWEKDMKARGITNSAFREWSKYSVNFLDYMINPSDIEYWRSKEEEYKQLAELKPTTTDYTVKNGTLTLKPNLTHHAVVFYEIDIE